MKVDDTFSCSATALVTVEPKAPAPIASANKTPAQPSGPGTRSPAESPQVPGYDPTKDPANTGSPPNRGGRSPGPV